MGALEIRNLRLRLRWVINENIVTKQKKGHQLFSRLAKSHFLGKSVTKNDFPRRMPESAYRHLFCMVLSRPTGIGGRSESVLESVNDGNLEETAV